MENYDSYVAIMKDTETRKNEARVLIEKLQISLKMVFSNEVLDKLFDVLTDYEIEDGASIFIPSYKPREKKRIAKIDLGQEYMVLWWGKNRKPTSYSKYALGVTFEKKKPHEIFYCTAEEIKDEFPDFKDILLSVKRDIVFTVHVYAKAGSFYKAVENMPGEWLLQVPKGKSFIPYNPIGKKVSMSEFHIYQPHKQGMEYQKKIKII